MSGKKTNRILIVSFYLSVLSITSLVTGCLILCRRSSRLRDCAMSVVECFICKICRTKQMRKMLDGSENDIYDLQTVKTTST